MVLSFGEAHHGGNVELSAYSPQRPKTDVLRVYTATQCQAGNRAFGGLHSVCSIVLAGPPHELFY